MSTESKGFRPLCYCLGRSQRRSANRSIRPFRLLSRYASAVPRETECPLLGTHALEAGEFHGMSISDATKKFLRSRQRQMNNTEILAELKAGGMVMASRPNQHCRGRADSTVKGDGRYC